ncbi:toxin Fic [Flavobacterium psychrophilum]|uniref:RhuM protein n=1 Tax=Flavobacterium psychrophilum (strain ATCC 49511 / DSM 21280 / CIP 103535 / JIP02/86) TaxID=402612 RepID=A6H1K5_FLAPJ|nr:virulence RhuM family protein [Flavobacterium psychrophilum]AIG30906.1 toxin Fic [Flavobacterium psychrophilum]AIG33179.1 toxin Fic [Flavobacterium psychrophilum]AIG35332.1 toxin Fic [Flavobacterium psychrophilum]AIG37693.1 toxin Fic [Flavobacterium psychrophilum]AIG39965.1 toxin Fic [Flavobacterium psychrophilum]
MEEGLSKFILYTAANGAVRVDVLLKDETVWLSQKAMSALFECSTDNVSLHLKNIFEINELEENSVTEVFSATASDGKNYNTKHYNLDAIISVGYRVNSVKAVQFRKWATQALKEYIVKGFVLDDDRLKQGQTLFGKDYFKELLQRVRSIRASERRIYQQVTDIFAECCTDYDKNSEISKNFYAIVQNKFHFAITGKTAAEIIFKTANSKKENMGLTSWKNGPEGRVLKQDVIIAKNYLQEKEIKQLERTITSYFDYIEGLIERQNTFTMEQLATSVNKFLSFNDYKILQGKGVISKIQADKKAIKEYDTFNKTQKIISDFDKVVKGLEKGKK